MTTKRMKRRKTTTNEYIRREDAVNAVIPAMVDGADAEIVEGLIYMIEPADVVQVVHGHWEYIDDTYCGFKDTDVRCSVCKTTTNIKRFRKTKWCPDCGAKMDGEE